MDSVCYRVGGIGSWVKYLTIVVSQTSLLKWFLEAVNKHIVKEIIDLAIFLEFSGGKVLDPDASIEAMEQLAGELQCMSGHERDESAVCICDCVIGRMAMANNQALYVIGPET